MADSDDKDSKTEEPTEKKLRDEVERGHVPVSREATIFASFAGLMLIAAFVIRSSTINPVAALQTFFDSAPGFRLKDGFDATGIFGLLVMPVVHFGAPILLIICLAGVAASFAQNPFQIALERIQPDFSRISPVQGWSRVLGSQGRTEFLKSVLKFLTVGLLVIVLLRAQKDHVVNAMFLEPNAIPDMILDTVLRILAAISIATALLMCADLFWTRHYWRQRLRMTRQDVKDEMKQAEGDPLIKMKLRSLALDRARKRMMAAVPRATLVIANPTHYAIALRYVREEGGAPMVLAKGQDLIALKIREVAEQNLIPVVEDKALARSMFNSVEVDRPIPAEFYRAVAELIHFLHARNNRRVTGK
jgi:flagellar biosynthetic protein FlhB